MPILQEDLRDAARRAPLRKSVTAATGQSTAFLCHSHHDKDLAEGLQTFLQERGWNVYIDWQDTEMPPTPTSVTVKNIQARIKSCNWFLYLATNNSASSRWCPWEVGFADGHKATDKIIVLVTEDRSGKHYGNEYLNMYRQINTTKGGNIALFEASSDHNGMRIEKLS